MTISSIGSSTYYISQMATMRNRAAPSSTEQGPAKAKPDLSQLFGKLDTDSSGSLGQTEVQDLTEKISEATGVSVDLAQFMTTYDANEDGVLNQEEAVTALEANRPEGPPPEAMRGGMGPMQGNGGPDLSQMFMDADTDGDNSISTTEAESLADIISNATGTTMAAEDLITAYDADGNGVLSEEETTTALEANRPEGPPPPPERMTAGSEDSGAITAAAIEKYLKMAALGMDQAASDLFSMFGDNQSSVNGIV